ncbi:uncharacterized protein LOC133529192 [Cydia pomonella]|uniref:uncharacterized protein LOC133529192 n=1 Tax=Cydia pomonella TaxID=82600 RepID=UPI002ADDD3CC|nr:uncharacterized protein LOC133529192 [Cydia pomonella]
MLSQYADDFVIYKKSHSLSESIFLVQNSLNETTKMFEQLGLEISASKTKVCLFTRGRKVQSIDLKHNNNPIRTVDKVKYLGFWLDKALLFSLHINEMRVNISKYLNKFKVLTGPSWGVHPSHLRRLYIALIRSRLDYACFLYDCSAESHVIKLDRLQNQALRIIGGFIKSTPIHVMESELCLLPLYLRRSFLAYKYCLKCLTWTKNNTVELLMLLDVSSQNRYWRKKKTPLLMTVYHDIKDERISMSNPLKMFCLETWVSNIDVKDAIITDLGVAKHPKNTYYPCDLRNIVSCELSEKYKDWHTIYTDGSKSESNLGAAYHDPICNVNISYKITSEICIMSAELFAISEAISYAVSSKLTKVVILTDSKSALQHVARCTSGTRGTALAYTVLQKLRRIPADMVLRLQWIPSHIGLRGNDEVDKLAKAACTRGAEVYVTPEFTEKLHIYSRKTRCTWKEHFDERCKEKGVWYKSMQCEPPHIPWFTKADLSRKLIKIALRLRSGHIPLNKFAYLMKKEPSPNCEACNKIEDVQHVLTECVRNEGERLALFRLLSLNRLDMECIAEGSKMSGVFPRRTALMRLDNGADIKELTETTQELPY